MRIFLAGATGAIGRQLVPLLVADGHDVVGSTRSPAKVDALRRAGAEAVVLDALDAAAVRTAVSDAHPDALIHEITALPQRIDPRKMERDFAPNDRLRSEGTRYLVDAAQAAGATRIVAQSIAFAYAPGPPGAVHGESDPLLPAGEAHRSYRRSAQAMADLERIALGADGLVLRYGYFYGPGTAISRSGSMGADVARRRLPIVGRGSGVWSFVHIEDAAEATVAALSRGAPGAYNVVDDEPAAVADWLPALAESLGAPRPLRLPALLVRPLAGSYGVTIMTSAQGASNELAKRELGWQPRHPSWREGFRSAMADSSRAPDRATRSA